MLVCLRREVQPEVARGMPVVREESFQGPCFSGIKSRGDGFTVDRAEEEVHAEIQELLMERPTAVLPQGGQSAPLSGVRKPVTKNQFLLRQLARILGILVMC